jgi:hypothetical protein
MAGANHPTELARAKIKNSQPRIDTSQINQLASAKFRRKCPPMTASMAHPGHPGKSGHSERMHRHFARTNPTPGQ